MVPLFALQHRTAIDSADAGKVDLVPDELSPIVKTILPVLTQVRIQDIVGGAQLA